MRVTILISIHRSNVLLQFPLQKKENAKSVFGTRASNNLEWWREKMPHSCRCEVSTHSNAYNEFQRYRNQFVHRFLAIPIQSNCKFLFILSKRRRKIARHIYRCILGSIWSVVNVQFSPRTDPFYSKIEWLMSQRTISSCISNRRVSLIQSYDSFLHLRPTPNHNRTMQHRI